MKAAVVREHGGPDRLNFEPNFPDPKPGEGDVIVAVKASSLNYHDVFTRRGMPGIKVPMPAIMGLDVAGEIAEVGPGFNSSIPPLLMEKYLSVAEAALDEVIKPDQLKVKWSGGQMAAVIDGKKVEGSPELTERRITGPGEASATFIAPTEGSYTWQLSNHTFGKDPRPRCRDTTRDLLNWKCGLPGGRFCRKN